MSNVSKFPELPISSAIIAGVTELDVAIRTALDNARLAGIPIGLVIACLHGHMTILTLEMIDRAPSSKS